MFRFSSFATKGKTKPLTKNFSSIYEAHILEEQFIHVKKNFLDILLWVRLIGIVEVTDFAIRHIDYIKQLKSK